MFIATGRVLNARTQSMILVSEPGSGKSELLDLFRCNGQLRYASDLTVQSLYPIIKSMGQHATTHIVATEFQKFFLRKASTAENTLGTLCQMMEEGVGPVLVGGKDVDFGGAQGGIIGAITHKTVAKWKGALAEYGFWSRCAAFSWEMPLEEMRGVMQSISAQDRSDLAPALVPLPHTPVVVDFPQALSSQFEDFVMTRLTDFTPLRVFQRFRALAMGCALLDGRRVVHARDVEKVAAFESYWVKMIRG